MDWSGVEGQVQDPIEPGLAAYLRTMEAVGMPLHQILPLAEQEGMSVPAMVDWAGGFLRRVVLVDDPQDAVVFVFGCVRRWKSLLPQIKGQGTKLLVALLIDRNGRLESLARQRDTPFFRAFRNRVLKRIGYPTCLVQLQGLQISSPRDLKRVMTWLGSGGPVITYELRLRGFRASSPTWSTFDIPLLELREGKSPERIQWSSLPMGLLSWHRMPTLVLQGVEGLRHLSGVSLGHVTLQSCPNLESLDGPAHQLTVEDCPRLKNAWIATHSELVTLRHCETLESLRPWGDEYPSNTALQADWIYELKELQIEDCRMFRRLPPRLHVKNRLHLHGLGQIEDWPWDFRVGESFLISDCPNLETLPAVEVQGSLVIMGASGLRHLSPGTVIGKNLDLRACTKLEAFPRGLRVGGNIYLPEHLNHRRVRQASYPMVGGELLEASTPDLYEDLRNLLQVLRFPALLPSDERVTSRELAEERLDHFRTRVAQEPRFESLLLWTASEVWRDLAEEAWAACNPLAEGRNEVNEDLPLAWFLDLVRG